MMITIIGTTAEAASLPVNIFQAETKTMNWKKCQMIMFDANVNGTGLYHQFPCRLVLIESGNIVGSYMYVT